MTSKRQHGSLFSSLIVMSFIVATVCWSEDSLQIVESERKIVLTGEISKALGTYDEHLQGAVEYLVCGRGGKEYETIIVVDSSAEDVSNAMRKLGVEKGEPPSYDEEQDQMISPTGPSVLLFVEWTIDGQMKKVRAEDLLYNVRTEKTMRHVAWIFSGSRMIPDLDSDDEDAMIPQAFTGNDIVALNHLDGSALFQNPLPEAAKENTYKKNEALLPPLGTPVKLTIEVNQQMQYYILISGDVQGVGFRYFTRQNAVEHGIHGYAKNLEDGRVEVVAEGDKVVLDLFVAILREGPDAATVKGLEIEQRPFVGEYSDFGIEY